MKNSALVATFDALVAYAAMFIIVGTAVVLLSNSLYDESQTTVALNQWAEDIAEAYFQAGMDVADREQYGSEYDLCTNVSELHKDRFSDQMLALAVENNLVIEVSLQGDGVGTEAFTDTYPSSASISGSRNVGTAKRLMIQRNPGLDYCVLTVKVGTIG